MIRYLVLPVARLADLDVGERRLLRRRLLRLGEPNMERAGVVGRRICFAHHFSAEHIDDLTELAAVFGATLSQLLKDEFPTNWRRLTPPVGSPEYRALADRALARQKSASAKATKPQRTANVRKRKR